jgi:hypothetical protein
MYVYIVYVYIVCVYIVYVYVYIVYVYIHSQILGCEATVLPERERSHLRPKVHIDLELHTLTGSRDQHSPQTRGVAPGHLKTTRTRIPPHMFDSGP